jgi:hypothetical protein
MLLIKVQITLVIMLQKMTNMQYQFGKLILTLTNLDNHFLGHHTIANFLITRGFQKICLKNLNQIL